MAKRAMLAGFAMVFAVGLSVAGQDSAVKSGSWSGVITNDMCGARDASAAKDTAAAPPNASGEMREIAWGEICFV